MKNHLIQNVVLSCILTTCFVNASEQEKQVAPAETSSGFSGQLYWQSYRLSKPDLLVYAFDNNLFESHNKDHRELVQDALLDCVKTHNSETLTKILTTINEQYSDERLLRVKTCNRIYSSLKIQQTGTNLATHKSFVNQQKDCLNGISSSLNGIQENIADIMAELENRKQNTSEHLEAFRADYRKRKKTTHLLYTLCPAFSDEIADNDSDFDDNGTLINPDSRDDEYINQKVTQFNTLIGHGNTHMQPLMPELLVLQETVNKLLALCPSESK